MAPMPRSFRATNSAPRICTCPSRRTKPCTCCVTALAVRSWDVRTISHLLRWLRDEVPDLLQNCRLQYQTDSQAASFCIIGMKGANGCLEAVAEVHRLGAISDSDIEGVSRPRTDEWQQHAGALSTYEDRSHWSLHPWVYILLLDQPELEGRRPVLDVSRMNIRPKSPGNFTRVTGTLPRSTLTPSHTVGRLSQIHPRRCCTSPCPSTFSAMSCAQILADRPDCLIFFPYGRGDGGRFFTACQSGRVGCYLISQIFASRGPWCRSGELTPHDRTLLRGYCMYRPVCTLAAHVTGQTRLIPYVSK